MTYVVTESCVKCKYTDCVDVCPVDCFHEGPNFLVIDPEECIDCTLCVAECPVEAIFAEDDVPDDQQDLEALPGVGRKTANVIRNTAFGHPTIAVDTHIFRVANRTRIAPGKNVLEVEKKLLKFIPDEFKLDAHHWLILHGRYVCVARKPRCAACVIEDLCEYKQKVIE